MAEVDFNACPIGRKNEQDIALLGDKFSMALERMEEKMEDIKTSIHSINKRLDVMDKKIDEIKESLPEEINKQIEENKHFRIYSMWKWFVGVLCSSIFISLITKLVLTYFNL